MAKSESKKPATGDTRQNDDAPPAGTVKRPKEVGGPKGPEPTRYGDWEKDGRVSDF